MEVTEAAKELHYSQPSVSEVRQENVVEPRRERHEPAGDWIVHGKMSENLNS